MAASDTVNRIFREFRRYTGDGMPGEPTGAPLPVGDPQSGPYHPKKSELRGAFVEILGSIDTVVGDATAQAERAEAAAIAAESAVSGVVAPKSTVAAAIADDPDVDPAYYDVAFFDTAQHPGSGAMWTKVTDNPGLAAGAAFQNANGTWYVNNAEVLRPEMFGRIGVNAAGDTAAWVALASVANSRTRAYVVAEGLYQVAGSTVIFDGSLTKLTLRLLNAEFYQQSTFAKTIRIENISDVRVHGGYFEGLGGTSGEYNGVSSSYNGVAAVHFLNCDKVFVSNCSERLHAGGGFVVQGGRVRRFENVVCEGIGYPYIDPIGQGNQGNGSDFGIMCQPSANTPDQLFKYEDTYTNVRIFNHAFGLMSVATRALTVSGCDIGPCPGQHGMYLIECDGVTVTSNKFRETRQFALKNQLEVYARFMAPAWASGVSYVVGQKVVMFSLLYRCVSAHTSGGSFDSSKFAIDPLNFRTGGVIAGNVFEGCGQGIGQISTSAGGGAPGSDGRYIFSRTLEIRGNTFRNAVGPSIYLDRALEAAIENNSFTDTGAGGSMGYTGDITVYLNEFSGRIANNHFRRTARSSVYAALAGDLYYLDNVHVDCGLAGTVSDNQTPSLVVFNRNATTQIPDTPTLRYVNFRRNEIRYTGTEGPAPWLMYSADSNVVCRLSDTRSNTGSAKLMRVEGGVAENVQNDFNGFFNTAQNETPFTTNGVTLYNLPSGATLSQLEAFVHTMTQFLKAKRIIR